MSQSEQETSPLLSLDKERGFDLWMEHARALKTWDDLSLARWLNQILSQLQEKSWRASHPLVVAYRLGAMVAHQRDLWNRRTFTFHSAYPATSCCGAPTIPFVSFEVCSHGFYCSCCGEILSKVDNLRESLAKLFQNWGRVYDSVHQVAHRKEEEKAKCEDYNKVLDQAASQAAPLLARLGYQLAPKILDLYPAVIWEDSDHCLDVIPEEVHPQEE